MSCLFLVRQLCHLFTFVIKGRMHTIQKIYIYCWPLLSISFIFKFWYCFSGVPVESVRLRFAFLQSINNTLETIFLPMVDLRPAKTYNRSTAAAVSHIRGLMFYDSKVNFVNRVMNATAKRKPDQAAPEVTLDPLETLSGK